MSIVSRQYLVARAKFFFNYHQVRTLPRWSQRKPVQVIASEDYDEETDKKKSVTAELTEEYTSDWASKSQDTSNAKMKINWQHPKRADNNEKAVEFAIKSKFQEPLTIRKSTNKAKPVDMLETTIDSDGNFIYTKMEDNDVRIGKILVGVKSKKEKTTKNLMLLEGKRLIKEALDAECKLDYLLFSRIEDVEFLRPSFPKVGVKLYKMPYRELQLWSNLTTCPGIMGKNNSLIYIRMKPKKVFL